MNKIGRTVAIVGVIVALFAVIILNSSTKQSAADQVWNRAATMGDPEAKNLYVMYTDIMCPYCVAFSQVVMENEEKFEQYLADNHILFEVRLTDYIYEGHGIQSSRDSAEATYCAARENKFWEYYHGALRTLDKDYFSKGIGISKTAPSIGDLPDDYWLKIGHEIGLGEEFDQCVANHETADELDKNTAKAAQIASGMPYFKFNRFTTAGFDNNWGWEYVEMYLDAGLGK